MVRSEQGRNRSLDGLRAVAILLVIFEHAQLPGFGGGGMTGVTLFFALSGFLITSLLLEERERTGTIRLRYFYARRALRLIPLLLLVVTFAAAFELLTRTRDALSDAAIALSYTTDIVRATGGSAGLLNHTWSLSVEEHFYLIWPVLIIVVMARARNPRRAVGIVALAGAVGSMAVRFWLLRGHWGTISDPRVEFGFDTRCDALFLGCAVAALYRDRASRLLGPAALLAAIALITLTASGLYVFALGPAAVACAILVPYAWTHNVPILSSTPAVWIGRRSYALYLWHVPLFFLLASYIKPGLDWTYLSLGFVVPLSFLLAMLSYDLVERPALGLKTRFERVSLSEGDREAAQAHRAVVLVDAEPGSAAHA